MPPSMGQYHVERQTTSDRVPRKLDVEGTEASYLPARTKTHLQFAHEDLERDGHPVTGRARSRGGGREQCAPQTGALTGGLHC